MKTGVRGHLVQKHTRELIQCSLPGLRPWYLALWHSLAFLLFGASYWVPGLLIGHLFNSRHWQRAGVRPRGKAFWQHTRRCVTVVVLMLSCRTGPPTSRQHPMAVPGLVHSRWHQRLSLTALSDSGSLHRSQPTKQSEVPKHRGPLLLFFLSSHLQHFRDFPRPTRKASWKRQPVFPGWRWSSRISRWVGVMSLRTQVAGMF